MHLFSPLPSCSVLRSMKRRQLCRGSPSGRQCKPLKVFVVLMLEYRGQSCEKRLKIQSPFRVNWLCISLGRLAGLNTIPGANSNKPNRHTLLSPSKEQSRASGLSSFEEQGVSLPAAVPSPSSEGCVRGCM